MESVLTLDTGDATNACRIIPAGFRKIFLQQVSPRPLWRGRIPTRSSDKRPRRYANLAVAAALPRV